MKLPTFLSLDTWLELSYLKSYDVYSNLYERVKEIEAERDELIERVEELEAKGGEK